MSSPKVSLPAGSSYPDAEGMQFTGVFAGEANRRYLETKVSSTGHTIHLPLPLLAA